MILLLLTCCLIFFLRTHFRNAPSRPQPLVNFSLLQCFKSSETLESLKNESEHIHKRSKETALLYALAPGETLKDITQAVLDHPNTSDRVKLSITENQHRYFIFTYPSDGLMIKGYISIPVNNHSQVPLIIYLRGGNRLFGLPHPNDLSTEQGYALIAPSFRDGVSEGEDEFGGNDVNDVKHLFDYLPNLEQQLKIQFHPVNKYMIGVSRGGMELFLALGRFPELQHKIKKVVSISGLLNIERAVADRPDFRDMLIEDFGLPQDDKAAAWLAERNPIHYASKIDKRLPIMIAQGTADNRVCLIEGYDMLQALHDAKHEVTYVEIEGGDHVLRNSPDFTLVLMNWLSA